MSASTCDSSALCVGVWWRKRRQITERRCGMLCGMENVDDNIIKGNIYVNKICEMLHKLMDGLIAMQTVC